MNNVRMLALATVAMLVAACSTTPAQPKGPDLSGQWVLTTESPMGAQDSDMNVTQTGDALAGTIDSQMGSVDFSGSVAGPAVKFGFVMNAQGMELPINYDGVVEGDTMQGKAVFGSFGEGNFTAKRKAD